MSDIFKKHGFTDRNEIQTVAGVTVYPTEYFCPKNFETGELNITDNTHSIHWFDGSWLDDFNKEFSVYIQKIYSKYGKTKKTRFLIVWFHLRKSLKYFGLKKWIHYWIDFIKSKIFSKKEALLER